MPYNSGALATERSVSYKMPVPTSSRYSGSSSATATSYRSSLADRPYYSSTTGSYSSTRSTLPRSPLTTEYRLNYSATTSNLSSRTSSLPTHSRQSSLSDLDTGATKRGASSRDRSETREPSSTSATSASAGATRTNGRYDTSSSTGTLSRRGATSSTADSDFYNKYSPSNYVPNSDIGRPPATKSSTVSDDKSKSLPSSGSLRSRSTKNAVNEVSYARSGAIAGGCSSLERRVRQVSIEEDTDTSSSRRVGKRAAGAADKGLTGLVNIGNTCFMNSVIQCLSNTKPLVEYLLADTYINDLNHNSGMKGKLISAFSEMIRELWSKNGEVASPVAFKAQISKYAPRFMGYAQQDAQEFLRFLLEGVHEDVNRVKTKPRHLSDAPETNASADQKAVEQWKRYLRQDDSKIVDLFVGQLRSTLRCSVCGHCSTTFDPFWDLQLPIPSRTGQLRLQQCLDHFTTEEVLDGNEKAYCAQCEKNQKSTKSFTIQKFPKILVLQLNRFSPTDRYRRKLSVTVDFPLDHLDLSNYSSVRGGPDSVYRLYGVSNHTGSPSFGHYTAYCKHPYSGEWHEYNDSRVSSISTRSIVSSEAYLLFYEMSGRGSHL